MDNKSLGYKVGYSIGIFLMGIGALVVAILVIKFILWIILL